MPTYEYKCDACEHAFEKFQSITSRSIRKCPECGKMKVRRLIGSGGGIIFKGSGFYQTDYRSSDYQKAAGADKKPAATSDSSSAKTETKTPAASDSGSTGSTGKSTGNATGTAAG